LEEEKQGATSPVLHLERNYTFQRFMPTQIIAQYIIIIYIP